MPVIRSIVWFRVLGGIPINREMHLFPLFIASSKDFFVLHIITLLDAMCCNFSCAYMTKFPMMMETLPSLWNQAPTYPMLMLEREGGEGSGK